MYLGEALAQKYAEKKLTHPMGAIWCHYVVNENKERAKTLWSQYIQGSDRVYYWPIIAKANKENNETVVLELIDCLQSPGPEGPRLDSAYNTLLEIYARKKLFDEALGIVETMKTKSLKFNRKTLLQISYGLKSKGQEFPYRIPGHGHKVVLK